LSFFDKTPREVALELEVRDLKRRLRYYDLEEKYRGEEFSPVADGTLNLGVVDMKELQPRIMLPKRAQITAAMEADMTIRVEGRTFPPTGKDIGIAYYLSGTEIGATDQAQLLGHMHYQFTRQLANFIKDQL
jgi:hypothetical protein